MLNSVTVAKELCKIYKTEKIEFKEKISGNFYFNVYVNGEYIKVRVNSDGKVFEERGGQYRHLKNKLIRKIRHAESGRGDVLFASSFKIKK